MKIITTSLALMAAGSLPLGTALAQAPAPSPYTANQVYFVLHESIREVLGIERIDPQETLWLSLSTVGTIAETSDPRHISDVANFCPPATPVLAAFAKEPKLDDVYLRLIDYSVSPVRTFSKDYKAARAYLATADNQPSTQVLKYRDMQRAHTIAWNAFHFAKDPAERQLAFTAMNNAERDWETFGYRAEVEKAHDIMAQEESSAGHGRNLRRRNVLNAYKGAALLPGEIPGSFVSPTSTFAPVPQNWETAGGWVSINFSSDQQMSRYNHEESNRSGFGGMSLGFLSIGGTAGGKQTTEQKVKHVYKLEYQVELMRASIKRPWLDTSLMFLPLDWTWKKSTNTKAFPYVAVARDAASGRPLQPLASIYDNKPVACPLLPLEAIVARKRKIVATVSKSDYETIVKSGSSSAGGSLFGMFGGAGKQNWSTTKVSETSENVTFSLEAPGTAIVGLISQFVPVSPTPNLADKWPKNAWIPSADNPAEKP